MRNTRSVVLLSLLFATACQTFGESESDGEAQKGEDAPLTKGGKGSADSSSPPDDKPAQAVTPVGEDCFVQADSRLRCRNDEDAIVRDEPTPLADIVDYVRSTESTFSCFIMGEITTKANRTWYYTSGSDNHSWGFVQAGFVETPKSFDEDPSIYGLPRCPENLE